MKLNVKLLRKVMKDLKDHPRGYDQTDCDTCLIPRFHKVLGAKEWLDIEKLGVVVGVKSEVLWGRLFSAILPKPRSAAESRRRIAELIKEYSPKVKK